MCSGSVPARNLSMNSNFGMIYCIVSLSGDHADELHISACYLNVQSLRNKTIYVGVVEILVFNETRLDDLIFYVNNKTDIEVRTF